MRNLDTRLARLEGHASSAAWIYVVEEPKGAEYDIDALLRSLGHDVARRDLVVRIARFGEGCSGPALLSAAPMRS